MSNQTTSHKNVYVENPSSDQRFVNKECSNVKSDLIEITEDKLRIKLLTYGSNLKTRHAWTGPLSMFSTVVAVLISVSSFEKTLGIPGDIWYALFLLMSVFSFIWLLYSIFRLYFHWKESTVEFLISEIKTPTVTNPQRATLKTQFQEEQASKKLVEDVQLQKRIALKVQASKKLIEEEELIKKMRARKKLVQGKQVLNRQEPWDL